ncbi:DUF4062 domain-containing protein [Tsuneonella mangrovi]|uniref:DUF4062 domain-containing protein n=1 Tax=Tsuneonella mangrovi TaxID=1982042 RepID=UPI001237471C|nr:DUF4062 domain-containing protein [Tsuneonella mangrovi]
MKVFASSVMQGFEEFREAAFSAIRSLDHQIVRAVDLPVSSTSFRIACLPGIRTSRIH